MTKRKIDANKILFYLEPSLEMPLNPLFRYPTLRNSIIPQIESLREYGHDVFLIASDEVLAEAIKNGYSKKICDCASIDMLTWSKFKKTKELHTIDELKKLTNIPFEPELVLSWESKADLFQTIFPACKVVYEMPGFFSRVPFPEMVSFDFGLLGEASQLIKTSNTKEEDVLCVARYRQKIKQFLSVTSPVQKEILSLRERFSTIVLFPLQIDGYFMIDELIQPQYDTQFELLLSLLENTPSDVALLVTNYRSKDVRTVVFSEKNINFLRKKFSNFVYIDTFELIPYVSQFLASEVDGTITISSSVGFQSAFWQKPTYTLGKCHISPFATTNDYAEFIQQCQTKLSFSSDDKVASLFLTSHITVDMLTNSVFFGKWIAGVCDNGFFQSRTAQLSLYDELASRTREAQFLLELDKAGVSKNSHLQHFCEELSLQIKKHEIISFDIFDTLLTRTLKNPSDLYDLIQEAVFVIIGRNDISFKKVRRHAERIAFKEAIGRGEGETTIDEIYSHLQLLLGVSVEKIEEIKKLEMQTELEVLKPRLSGFLAYNEAKSQNKKIILVSDMYLPKDFLAKVLAKNGFADYEQFYLSSEYKAKKHSGKLFDFVIEDYNEYSGKILHVGDNVDADVKKAKEKGLKPFHLIKSMEVFEKSYFYKKLWEKDVERHNYAWGSVLAIIADKYHSNPYSKELEGTFFGGSAELLGFGGFGPLLLGYTKWLIENAIADGVKELFFLSRDGKIMKEAYDIIAPYYNNAPRSTYLLCSRRAVNVAKLTSYSDILDLLNVDFAKNSLSHLLKSRFGIDAEAILDNIYKQYALNPSTKISMDDKEKIEPFFKEIAPLILENAIIERMNYLEYLDTKGFLSKEKKAIVDIGYAGTMQESLFQLAGQIPIDGYYLMTFRAAKKRLIANKLGAKAYLADFVDRHDTYHPFCRHVPLYETLFSGVETTFIKIEKATDGTLLNVFMDTFANEKRRSLVVSKIQGGALEFVETVSQHLKSFLNEFDIEPNKSIRTLSRFFDEPKCKDALIFSNVVFEDSYGGAGLKTILPSQKDMAKSSCVWEIGRGVILLSEQNQKQKQPTIINPQAEPLEHMGDSIKYKIAKMVLGERKYGKLIKNPALFFADAKSPVTLVFKSLYLTKKEGVA